MRSIVWIIDGAHGLPYYRQSMATIVSGNPDSPENVKTGQAVRAVFNAVTDDVTLPKFEVV